jgi:HrpA-like RNA helicase
MAVREYLRICKQAGCGQTFIVSAPSIEEDRLIGFSEPEYCPKHRAMHARSYSRIACHHYEVELTLEGQDLIKSIERSKKHETEESKDTLGRVYDPWEMPGKGVGPGGIGRFQRPLRGFIENTEFKPEKKDFQIVDKSDDILAALDDHQVVILVGTTGSGKSTYIPWLLLTGGEPGKLSKWAKRGPICITQPRIQATQQIPKFIANTLNGTSAGIGAQIGFTHSKEDAFDRRSRLLFMTDGKLINSIVSGTVGNYSIVMIDEAHERSVNIELILGLLRDQLYLYPHLRLIIASATIDFNSFLTYFYPSLDDDIKKLEAMDLKKYGYFSFGRKIPFVYSEGRRHSIAKHFWGNEFSFTDDKGKDTVKKEKEILPDWWKGINNGQVPLRDQLPSAITELVRKICEHLDKQNEAPDDISHILVFLPGSHEINKTVSLIRALKLENVAVFPLYAQRPLDEQEEALKPNKDNPKHENTIGKRRVVVSTNVAETSLTVEGVRYVIDSGYIKAAYWNPYLQISELQTLFHSKSGCRQRWGRAGRVSDGHSFMLYTQSQFEDTFPDYTIPEIARSSLEQVILTAKAAGVRSIKNNDSYKLDFAWMPLARAEDTQRLQDELDRAFGKLIDQGAVDGKTGDLTRLGLELRGMPAEMDVARIFTIGEQHALGIEVATLLPFLNADRGLQTVLDWNQENGSYTKLRIRQNQLDFIYGCKDDLDVYLKLWTLWDKLTTKQRQRWEETAGINYKNFDEQIDAERRKLLEMAIDWRKAENRPIELRKLDTLRALIAYSLQQEIYQPAHLFSSDKDAHDRFQRSANLAVESFSDDEVYQEYDDEFQVDEGASSNKQMGLFRRLSSKDSESEDSSIIEIAPISICYGSDQGNELFVICQRRANYMRTARAKVLGMNVVKIDKDWLEAVNGSLVERSLLFSRISRESLSKKYSDEIRLFLPWFMPRGRKYTAKVLRFDPDNCMRLELTFNQKLTDREWVSAIIGDFDQAQEIDTGGDEKTQETSNAAAACIMICSDEDRRHYQLGDLLEVRVVGYRFENDEPIVEVREDKDSSQAFDRFQKKFAKKIGEKIEIEMCEILEDPLGRDPLFIVRERETGLEIPMADTDFCGNNHPQLYFGTRFSIGEPFDVILEEINEEHHEVYLSRGKKLLDEYLAVTFKNNEIIEIPVLKVDHLGAYFILAGTGGGSHYVGFTRKSMWPAGFSPEIGTRVEARFRRFERNIDPQKLQEKIKNGETIPDELDLGIDLDLRTPPNFRRFYKENHAGDIITAVIEKYLDSGSLLLGVDHGLKAVVYPSEFEFDDKGRLKKSRDYKLGGSIDVLLAYMNKHTARISCSISRKLLTGVFAKLSEGEIVKAQITYIEKYYKEPDKYKKITCSFQHENDLSPLVHFPLEMICENEEIKGLNIGSTVLAAVTYCSREENIISGKLEKTNDAV